MLATVDTGSNTFLLKGFIGGHTGLGIRRVGSDLDIPGLCGESIGDPSIDTSGHSR